MGRRSINTTKSGKYMNPTDQARKEARKKELKKNKKQRQMVRAAVLKGKDPAQLIEEMEKIDEMEYNVFQPSPLNEKVLREKRKKLKETFDRVMRLYHNDDLELWQELKRKENDYEKRRTKRIQYFESVKHAQTVQIDDIPLPQMSDPPTSQSNSSSNRIPLPATAPSSDSSNVGGNVKLPSGPAPPGILKKPSEQASSNEIRSNRKTPPGCPPGQPPDLHKMRELDSDYEDAENEPPPQKRKTIRFSDVKDSDRSDEKDNDDKTGEIDMPKPTSVQQRILALAGQRYDDFMKELENVHKKKEQVRANDLHDRMSSLEGDKKDDHSDEDDDDDSDSSSSEEEPQNDRRREEKRDLNPPREPHAPSMPSHAPPMPPQAIKLPSGPPAPPMGMPPSMMFPRPPPMRPGMSGMPGMPRMPMPPRLRMPPGPPPGMPPARLMHNHHKQHQSGPPINTLAAAPQLTKDTKGMTTITAKPQIRNLSADVTRFVPTTLRIKRDDKKVVKPKTVVPEYRQKPDTAAKGTTKDDAYMQFMREMQGLL